MDSWKYSSMSEGKCVWLSEEVNYRIEGHNCKNKLMGCEIKPILNVESYPLISNTQALDRLDFMDLGFADDIRKSYSISSEPSGEVFSDDIGTEYHHPPLGEERESTDFMQSDDQDFSLFDLKLGSLADGGIVRNSELSKAEADVPESSIMVSPPAKKPRPTTVGVQSPRCQVLGCNKDLSSFKSYYKRHKVCDVHTKTPKVIVDGIERRFCQQCSRFHLLNEFDDIKRSCRRRLAAHNKRRRRPHLTSEPGSGIIDFSSSIAFPEGLPNVFLGSSKYEGSEDSIKSSNFLQMGCVEEKMDMIPANTKSNIFGLVTPTIQNISSIQHTSRALSLLSAQSQSISSHLLETTSTTLINKSGHEDSIPGHALNQSAGIIKRIAQSGPHAPGIYSMEADEEGLTTLNPSNGNTVGHQLQGDRISSRPSSRENDCLHPKGRGIILNLLQLSSHLERVEHQKHSTENEAG